MKTRKISCTQRDSTYIACMNNNDFQPYCYPPDLKDTRPDIKAKSFPFYNGSNIVRPNVSHAANFQYLNPPQFYPAYQTAPPPPAPVKLPFPPQPNYPPYYTGSPSPMQKKDKENLDISFNNNNNNNKSRWNISTVESTNRNIAMTKERLEAIRSDLEVIENLTLSLIAAKK